MSTETLDSGAAVPARALPGARPVSGRSRPWERADGWVPIALPCLLAAALVLYELGTRSLWLDEAASVSIASQHGSALWHAIARDGGNMLGYYLLLHVLIGAFGHGAAVIRLPSALATVGTVGLVSLIARRMLDRRAALAAGLLCAVSLPLVFWGQDARGYAPMMMFICASFLAFIALVDPDPRSGSDGSRSRWLLAAYVLSTVLAAYMSFVAALIVPAQLLALLWRRQQWRAVLGAVASIAVCCVPLVVLAERRGSGQLFWVPPPNLTATGQTARWLTSAGMPPNFHPTATTVVLLVISLGVIAAVLVAVARRGAADRGAWIALLVGSWLVVPVLLSVGESLAGQPILLYRNSLVSLPAVALPLAWGVTHPRLHRWLSWSAFGALLALRALQLAPSYGVSPENWKGATQYVLARAQAGDCVAFYPSDGRMPFSYYAGSAVAARQLVPVLPAASWSATTPYVERYTAPSPSRLSAIESSCPRLWLIASHVGAPSGTAASRSNYARYVRLHRALGRNYPQRGTARFGWASPVTVELLARREGREARSGR